MLIGILSDTHGRTDMAHRAIALLLENGSEFLIHCGDVGDDVLELLPTGKSAFVFGNNDYGVTEMRRQAAELNIQCLGHGGAIELGGKKIGVAHGDQARILNGLIEGGVDYLLTGHTHVDHDRQAGNTRLINPGALHRAKRKTVALLELDTDVLKFETIDDPMAGR